MKLLIDMNLSPQWVDVFERHGWYAVHWSTVGDPRATDRVIMQWAQANGYIVFTHDLDFGTLLAVTRAESPSVIQVRSHDIAPRHLERSLVDVLLAYEEIINEGALVVIDEGRARVRILPLNR